MAGYRPLSTQTQSTSGSVSPSTIPVAHLQHPSNRNIGSIYHHTMGMSNAPGLVYPPVPHSLHGTSSISMQQHHHHHHQQHRHSMVHHHQQQHQQQQQQFQQHHQLLARHRHLGGNSTRHNNLLHQHGGTTSGGINMTTTIMPLNASK